MRSGAVWYVLWTRPGKGAGPWNGMEFPTVKLVMEMVADLKLDKADYAVERYERTVIRGTLFPFGGKP